MFSSQHKDYEKGMYPNIVYLAQKTGVGPRNSFNNSTEKLVSAKRFAYSCLHRNWTKFSKVCSIFSQLWPTIETIQPNHRRFHNHRYGNSVASQTRDDFLPSKQFHVYVYQRSIHCPGVGGFEFQPERYRYKSGMGPHASILIIDVTCRQRVDNFWKF